jgi:voltage-gated potassium channel Kch
LRARNAVLRSDQITRLGIGLLSEIERQIPLLLDQTTVVDFSPVVFQTLVDRGLHVIYGDISNVDTLVHAGVGNAELIILSVPNSLLKGANNEKLVRHRACSRQSP